MRHRVVKHLVRITVTCRFDKLLVIISLCIFKKNNIIIFFNANSHQNKL